MKLEIRIPEKESREVVDFLCEVYGYRPKVERGADLIDNPEPREVFAKRRFKEEFVKAFIDWKRRKIEIKTGIK